MTKTITSEKTHCVTLGILHFFFTLSIKFISSREVWFWVCVIKVHKCFQVKFYIVFFWLQIHWRERRYFMGQSKQSYIFVYFFKVFNHIKSFNNVFVFLKRKRRGKNYSWSHFLLFGISDCFKQLVIWKTSYPTSFL